MLVDISDKPFKRDANAVSLHMCNIENESEWIVYSKLTDSFYITSARVVDFRIKGLDALVL